jgi:hypothetical protein
MRPQATLALLAFAMLTTSLDRYIVVVALPSIERDAIVGVGDDPQPCK